MALTFTKHDDVVFDSDPLLLVLCQVKFQPIQTLLGEAGTAGFQELIRHEYPNVQKEVTADIELGAEARVAQRMPVWRFADSADGWKWRVGLAMDFVALETTAYVDFNDFADRLDLVLLAASKALLPSASTRIGLRKINELEHSGVSRARDWSQYLRASLVGMLGEQDMPAEVEFTFNDTRFQDADNMLAVRHGISQEDQKKYRLDLDYSTDRPYAIEPRSPMTDVLRTFSDGMTSFFHWALKEELLTTFKPRPRESRN